MSFSPMHRRSFAPDRSGWKHEQEREELVRALQGEPLEKAPALPAPPALPAGGQASPKTLSELIDLVSPEDSALIALIVFLLCDNSENDVVLLGILLYILLSK